MRDIDIIKKELPLDILEFFCLTPLPGSEDHKVLYLKGVPMDPDMNKYDVEHVCTGHPLMSNEAWNQTYRDAWKRYYTDEHVETVLRRAAVTGLRMNKIADVMTAFSSAARIEGVHPLQCGIVRRKIRTSRRHGMPIVNPLIFYPVRRGRVRFGGRAMADRRVALSQHQEARPRRSGENVLRRRRNAAHRHRGHGDDELVARLRRQDPGHLRRPEEASRRRF